MTQQLNDLLICNKIMTKKIGHYHPTTLFVSPKFSRYLYFLSKIMQKIWEKISSDIKYWYLQEKIIYENLFTIENLGNLGFFSLLQPNTKNKGGYMNGKRIQKLYPPWNTFNLNKKKKILIDLIRVALMPLVEEP